MGVSEITMYTIVGAQESVHTYGHHTKCGGGTSWVGPRGKAGPQSRSAPITHALSKDSRVLAANRKELVITTTKTEDLGI